MTDRNRARLRPFRDPANVERLVGMPAAALHSLQTSDPEIGLAGQPFDPSSVNAEKLAGAFKKLARQWTRKPAVNWKKTN